MLHLLCPHKEQSPQLVTRDLYLQCKKELINHFLDSFDAFTTTCKKGASPVQEVLVCVCTSRVPVCMALGAGSPSGQKGASPGRRPSPCPGLTRTRRRRRSGPPHGAWEVSLWKWAGLTAHSSPHASGPALEPLRPPSQRPQQSVPGPRTRGEGDGQSRSRGRHTPDLHRRLRPQGQGLHPLCTTQTRPARLGDRGGVHIRMGPPHQVPFPRSSRAGASGHVASSYPSKLCACRAVVSADLEREPQ